MSETKTISINAVRGHAKRIEAGLFTEWLNGRINEAEMRAVVRAFSHLHYMLAQEENPPDAAAIEMSETQKNIDSFKVMQELEQASFRSLLDGLRNGAVKTGGM